MTEIKTHIIEMDGHLVTVTESGPHPWPSDDQGMSDRQFIKEASIILHSMALERKGFWAMLFNRWHISAEPLRNDAANLLDRYGFKFAKPEGTQYVNEKDTPS